MKRSSARWGSQASASTALGGWRVSGVDSWPAPLVLLVIFAVIAPVAVGLARFQPKEWDRLAGRAALIVAGAVAMMGLLFGLVSLVWYFLF